MEDLETVDGALSRNIVEIVESGNRLHMQGSLVETLAKYQQAWDLLPEPKKQWDLADWIASCFADALFEQGHHAESKAWAMIAIETKPPRATSCWIVYARACLALGETDLATEYFGKAFAQGKRRAFQGFDKQYLAFYLAQTKGVDQAAVKQGG